MTYSPYWTADQAAAHLNVSRSTVIRLIEDGDLKATKVRHRWRIHIGNINDYVLRNEINQEIA